MKKYFTITVFICIFVFTGLLAQAASLQAVAKADNTLQIILVYPQETNARKRELPKKQGPLVVTGDIVIALAGIGPQQLQHKDIYVEYFLDEELIYKTNKIEKFILKTLSYPDGKHDLVVNFWDKQGQSAIGIKSIIIKNKREIKND